MKTRAKDHTIGQIPGNGAPTGAVIRKIHPVSPGVKPSRVVRTHKIRQIPVAAVGGAEAGRPECPVLTTIDGFVDFAVLCFHPEYLWVGRVEGTAKPVCRKDR